MIEPRQRWRVFFQRGPAARDLPHSQVVEHWEAALEGSTLPIVAAAGQRARLRLAFAAPVPVGMTAEREILEFLLEESRPVAGVRAALMTCVPSGHDLLDLHDVWLGAPSVASLVAAMDYRVQVRSAVGASQQTELGELWTGVERILAASRLERVHQKGGRPAMRDLRPFIESLTVAERPHVALEMRLRTDPSAGVARPEEVLGALSDEIGREIVAGSIVRERLILADEV
jgi:radical SAM-linked protein